MKKNSISKLEQMLNSKGIEAERSVRTTGVQDDLYTWAVYRLDNSYKIILHDLSTISGTTIIGDKDTYSVGRVISPNTRIESKKQLEEANAIAEELSVELDKRPYQRFFVATFKEPQNAMIALEKVKKAHKEYDSRMKNSSMANYK
jgi:hypothetical protein